MPTVSRPGIRTKPKTGKSVPKKGRKSLKTISTAELESLTAEFDKHFPEMESNRAEVFIVVGLVLLAAVAACLYLGLN